jgi:hypothetical protein
MTERSLHPTAKIEDDEYWEEGAKDGQESFFSQSRLLIE